LQPTTQTLAHQSLRLALRQARAQTDRLFEIVRPEALYDRPIPERHRIVFYLGHLEAFDWNQVCRAGLDQPSFQPDFDRLFAFGIDPEVGREGSDTPADWPGAGEIRAYNRRTRDIFDGLLDEAPPEMLHLALEHRLMHAETLAYMLHQLPVHRKIEDRPPTAIAIAPVEKRMIEIPEGLATLGARSDSGFGWDNEFEEHAVAVPRFRIAQCMVTNGDYLNFVREGAEAPVFWTHREGDWFLRCMFDEIQLPLDWPVYVSRDQAEAYARWRGLALPSEAQFHRAAYGAPHGVERPYPWGEAEPGAAHGNFDFHRWDPVPVNANPAGDSAFGVAQTVGNGWEWTSTIFAPFEGFRPIPTYPGYSANFFDGEHYVMKGGSARTAACILRRSFRNWFRPNYPYVYAGFRLVEN
jgi:formylglycine-generating enzyme required for sulfatase activity